MYLMCRIHLGYLGGEEEGKEEEGLFFWVLLRVDGKGTEMK